MFLEMDSVLESPLHSPLPRDTLICLGLSYVIRTLWKKLAWSSTLTGVSLTQWEIWLNFMASASAFLQLNSVFQN